MKQLLLTLFFLTVILLALSFLLKKKTRRIMEFNINRSNMDKKKSINLYLKEIEDFFIGLRYTAQKTNESSSEKMFFRNNNTLAHLSGDVIVEFDAYNIFIQAPESEMKILLSHLDLKKVFL